LQADFQRLDLQRPEGLLAYHELDDADLRRLLPGALLNTDDRTLLEFRAPQTMFAVDLADENRKMIAAARTNLLPQDVPETQQATALLAAAETSASFGDTERTYAYLEPLLQTDPPPAAQLLRGRLELEQKRFANARDTFAQARKLDPQSLEAEGGLGRAMLGLGDSIAAEKLLSEVLARDPNQSQAITGMLELTTVDKDWTGAARWQEKRIALDPQMGCREYVRLGRDFLRAGDTAGGINWLEKALQRDSYCHPAHRTLAEQAIAARRWVEAKDHLVIFIRYAPDEDPSAYSSLAGVDVALGDSRSARVALEKGVRIFPGDANLRHLADQTATATR
jgi:tetratricopeptide (TPR) repeat protein